ncbi:MAG: 50S ribosomal protein L4 [Bacteroidetes bacterium]|jgi:large subunit ribosomal protein L4|nr:50S ribosomal protein L4 [Bacteroidota bacterium]
MKVDVLNIQGQTTGRDIELSDDIFGIEPNEHSVYLAVKQYLAHQRQGTHKTKERGEVKGSTKKIKRQKGTGTARFGDIKNPLFRGGGRIFGPRPRKYTVRLNKKEKQLARKSALSAKTAAEQLMVVEDFSFETPKTREFLNILNALQVADRKPLLVTGEQEKEVFLSSRNLPKVAVVTADELNTYQVMKAGVVLLSESAVDKITQAFANPVKETPA